MTSNVLSITKKYIEDRGGFTTNFPEELQLIVESINGDAPYKLKLIIAISELITLTSHLRKNIKLYDGTLVPGNAITFALAKSGISKDSTMNQVRKTFEKAYEVLNRKRKELAKEIAENKALKNNDSSDNWLQYYDKPAELQVGLGTVEGLVKHFSDIEKLSIGAASITSSEIGTELNSNKNFIDIVKTIAIGYDLGKIPTKVIKAAEFKVDSIKNLPINALFFGSEDAILYDNTIKTKFKLIFNTQLARRSLFAFVTEDVKLKNFLTNEDIFNYYEAQRNTSNEARQLIENYIKEMVEFSNEIPLSLTKESQKLFDIYLEYNKHKALEIPNQFQITKLSRKHKQWLALKLSGAFAILAGFDEIKEEHYITAINIVEYFSNDLLEFEKILIKESYELFADYCKNHCIEDNFKISIHEIKKLGYLPNTGNITLKLDELLLLANNYHKEGVFVKQDNFVIYTPTKKENTFIISHKEFPTKIFKSSDEFKAYAKKYSDSGYNDYELSFSDLMQMLQSYCIYAPFKFKNGKRLKSNIDSTTNLVVLDVDDCGITDEECHFMLSNYNHIIVRTKDNNQYKFRILLPLAFNIDIPNDKWMKFLEKLSEDLAIKIDILPKSSIFFSYADREIYAITDEQNYNPKKLLEELYNDINKKEKPLKKETKSLLLDNMRETFNFAFEAPDGQGNLLMVKAGLYAKTLGADDEYIKKLLHEINNYWTYPMDTERLEHTIIKYVLNQP